MRGRRVKGAVGDVTTEAELGVPTRKDLRNEGRL